MTPPLVAIVGWPNVGKSTLFNTLARRRIAIVEPTMGVTRDRVSTVVVGPDDAEIELMDTGGMGAHGLDVLGAEVENQIELAVADAAVLVLVVDATSGLTPQDREIAARLRPLGKPAAPIVLFAQTEALDHRAHRAIENQDALLQRGRETLVHCRLHAATRSGRIPSA